jgi:hypothetical protein
VTEFFADGDGSQEGLLAKRSATLCLSEKELEDFLFCRLSGVTREVIEEHLLVCHACLDRVEKEEHYIASMKDGLRQRENRELNAAVGGNQPASRKFRTPVWGAAAVVLALVAGLLWRYAAPGPSAEVRLSVTRSTAETGVGPAGGRLTLTADVSGLPEQPVYRIQLVRANGTEAASGLLNPAAAQVRWSPAIKLPPGQYWVRLSTETGELLREYSLRLR